MKTLAVCADDYGLSAPISDGIVRLARQGRLDAVSCLVTAARWPGDAARLGGLRVAAGLHLNLSEGAPLSAALARHWPRLPALPALILRAHAGALPRDALRAEIDAQLDAFRAATGRAPDFVDGHQHVHHLPGVRQALLERLAAPTAVRATGRVAGPGWALKRWLIEATGGRALQRALAARGQRHNAVLVGAYDFAATDYGALVRRWLAALPERGTLLFCHPGETDPTGGDPIGAARVRELAYLGSDAFARDLAAAGVVHGAAWR